MIGDKAANEPPFSLGLPPMPATYTDRLQGLSTSVAVKPPCRVATTVNIALSGLQTIDGVALSAGDRVLVKNQTDPVENGIYDASASDWHRALDFDGSRDVVVGTQVSVVEGSLQTDSYWRVTGVSAPRPSVDAIHFEVALFSIGSLIGFIAANRSILAGIVPAGVGQVAYLAETGREGYFIWHTGNYAPLVGNDPLQGLYVKSDSISSASGCWVRVWDGINGYPEWFYDNSGDWLAALNACETLCPVIHLGAKDYSISATWAIQTENRTVKGSSRFNRASGTGTRITMASATANIVKVGYDTQPAGAVEQDQLQGGFLKNVTLQDLAIWRTVAPSPWGTINDEDTVGSGLRVQYVLKCRFSNLLIQNSACGVYAGATIYTKFDDVEARIDSPTTAGNYDTCRGWFLDGNRTFGYAGGNASIYLNRCVGVANRKSGSTTDGNIPIALLMKGAFVDTFVRDFEVAGTSKGIVLSAPGLSYPSSVDVHIDHPIVDQCDTVGIEVGDINAGAAIEIIAPYVASNGSASYGISIFSGSGVTLLGGQLHGHWSGGAGLQLTDMGNVVVRGTKLLNCLNGVVINNSQGCEIAPQFIQSQALTAPVAVSIQDSSRCRIMPTITVSGSGVFTYGINLVSGNANLLLDVSGIVDGATTDRIRSGGSGGSAITTQGNVSGHVIINPGQGAML